MKRKFTLIIVLFFVVPFFSKAQIIRRPVAAPYIGLGAYSKRHQDIFSFTSNQAALAEVNNAAVGVYGERRFLLSDLNNYTAALAIPTSSGNFGLKTGYFGSADYNETQIGLAYGRKMGEKLDIGAQFNYNAIRIPGYGNSSAISFEIGTVLHLTDQLHIGIHANNPVGGKFGKDQEEKLPSVYSFGIGYDASEKFYFGAEILKEEDQPVNVNVGLQYTILPQLLARVGMETATSSAWAGIGVSWKVFRIDVTTTYHPQLGVTPGLLVLFNFNQEKD
ncbi:MAG TPA: hypothetical protein VHD35_15240 [Chitinophagaceae bacterium]|nr:hypothetical protein [Chitinophagaceae bacterium]